MPSVTRTIQIKSNSEIVWDTLVDIGNVSNYFSGVKSSTYIGDIRNNVGMARHCDITGGYLKERVIDWQDGKSFTLETYEIKGVPLASNIIKFSVNSSGENRTSVTQSMNYELSKGLLGFIMMPIMKIMLGKALNGALNDLRNYCENNNTIKLQKNNIN